MPRSYVGRSGVQHFDFTHKELDELVKRVYRATIERAPTFLSAMFAEQAGGPSGRPVVWEIEGRVFAMAYEYAGLFNTEEAETYAKICREEGRRDPAEPLRA